MVEHFGGNCFKGNPINGNNNLNLCVVPIVNFEQIIERVAEILLRKVNFEGKSKAGQYEELINFIDSEDGKELLKKESKKMKARCKRAKVKQKIFHIIFLTDILRKEMWNIFEKRAKITKV